MNGRYVIHFLFSFFAKYIYIYKTGFTKGYHTQWPKRLTEYTMSRLRMLSRVEFQNQSLDV